MWFAFKLCSLYIWLQHMFYNIHCTCSCDLLSNFALCTFDYNILHSRPAKQGLWFAFKLCSLYIWLQHYEMREDEVMSCDLLSNFALCTFDYNFKMCETHKKTVVICFQTLLFVHLITTLSYNANYYFKLWFAFKLCSLYIWLQHVSIMGIANISCDLLSNFALCTFDYNLFLIILFLRMVVICFQTLLFVHLITTLWLVFWILKRLWFAFKLCSLYIWLQHLFTWILIRLSCDLLSNFALCTFDYNSIYFFLQMQDVVICFQTLLFVHLITTFISYIWNFNRLWFAFKLCSLYIWLQHRWSQIGNTVVVICFQTLLFVHLITTGVNLLFPISMLWFAFKLCSLYIWLQRR